MTFEIMRLIAALALGLNIGLVRYIFMLKKQLKDSKKLSVDAAQLMHDLTRGSAVVKIIPIDPSELFYRSPR